MMTTFLAALAMALATSAGDAPSAPRDTPSAASLRAWHELLGSEPHVAGTPGDARQIERLRGAFVGLGLEVEVHEIFPLLCRPVAASLEVVESIDASDAIAEASPAGSATADAAHATPGPNAHPEARARRGVVGLDLRERNLLEDPATAHPDLTYGWNAYSGSGDVTAEPVYVNYATREDFERLRELGVDVAGKIAIARYGRNFRGDKVRFAERAGAVGLVIFSDPADVARGPAYPEGGWANDSCIQRGSVMRLGQPGDPLTPGVPATADAARLAPDAAGLPRIPVQPIGYAAAGSILGRMRGDEAPEAWRGGLTLPYRLTGGPGVRLHLRVEQAREIMRTANVVGTLRGTTDEFVVVGCHHDAWGFGAADPLAGTIVLMETARAFARAAETGWRPQRSIVFATWAAEEFGIIGSTEWCEQHADEISSSCVAYVNLDMAAMGTNFGAKASPLLSAAVLAAAGAVPQARAVAGEGGALPSALDAWKARTDDGVARVGLIDGGSDHEAFQFHLGVPSCQLGAGGSAGTSYHSNYDTIAWYRKVVGEDYEPALMVTRVCVDLVRRLADDPSPPLDPRALAPMIREALSAIDSPSPPSPASAGGGSPPRPAILPALEASIASLERAASAFADAAERADKDGAPRRTMATTVAQLERTWLSRSPGAPWRRHELIGTDPDAGYSPQALPLLRAALRSGDAAAISSAVEELRTSIDTVTHQLTHATTAPDNQ